MIMIGKDLLPLSKQRYEALSGSLMQKGLTKQGAQVFLSKKTILIVLDNLIYLLI